MKNTDTRVRYTRSILRQALLELLKEKSVDKVTVKELCERAKLNRGTFYLHYDSPAALLKDIEQNFIDENTRIFSSFWQEGREQSIMESLFSSIKANQDIFCILMGPHGDPLFVNQVFGGMQEQILNQWQAEFPGYAQEDLLFIFDYVLLGSTRLILNWLEDSKGITASSFARRIERLGHHALIAIKEF